MKKFVFVLLAICSSLLADITLDICLNINSSGAVRKVITFDEVTHSWCHDGTDLVIESFVIDKGDHALLDCVISHREYDDMEIISSPRIRLVWNKVSEVTICEDEHKISLSVIATRT